MSLANMTNEQLENRLTYLEQQMATTDYKKLASINAIYEKVLTELANRDVENAETRRI